MYLPGDLSILDEKASRAVGSDETAVRELAGAVVDWAVAGQLPELFSRPYKERLFRAEISFRRGDLPGARETAIVHLIDGLAQRLDAPDYARSDQDEVHQLRLTLSYMTPHIVVATPEATGASDPDSRKLTEVLSPIEAVFVTRYLLMQKQLSEMYQTTPSERSQVRKAVESLDSRQFQLSAVERNTIYYILLTEVSNPSSDRHSAQELAQRIVQARELQAQNSTRAETRFVLSGRVQSARMEQINTVFRRAFSMKISDALALADDSLELIGIPATSKN
jgi:hypothetical protein